MLALVATAVAYMAFGWAAMWLAAAPSYAAPLYPASGIALACVLTYGRRMLPAVAIGAFTVNTLLAVDRGAPNLAGAVLLPATVAIGATLQAAIGAFLVRRFSSHPLTLSEPRDVAVFFGLGGALASTICATLSAAGLYYFTRQPIDILWFSWWVWASGDALGVLIAGPIVLTLIGRPRSEWATRRLTVGLSLCVATVLIALSMKQVERWENDRVQASFDRDAVHASSNLAAQLQYPLHALRALRGAYMASEAISRDEMRRATSAWLAPGDHVQGMGWIQLIQRADAPAYEAEVRTIDFPSFRVHDRPGAPEPPRPDDMLAVIRYIEPESANAAALGVNARSSAEARAAIDMAIRTDAPAASASFRVTQATDERTDVVIYHALYRGSPTTMSERLRSASGVLFVTLKMDAALRAFQSSLPHYLHLCVVDTEPTTAHRRLAGEENCEAREADLLHVRPLAFAGRQWDLRVTAMSADLPDTRGRSALLFSLVGLLAVAMLGALLLTVTGRTRRIEVAVNDRTAALQHEITERERTEANLRESEQRFRNILNNVPIGVVYTDLQGNVKQVNPRFCELTGYTSDALMSMNVDKLTHPEDRDQDADLTAQLVRGDIPIYRRQGRYLTRDNRMVWVQSIVTLLRDVQGEPHRIVGVVEDITEHLRLAEAERAREIAEAANLAKSEFLSRMSHELRTPLNAMLGFAQLLELDQSAPLSNAQKPWVGQIQSAGWHLLDMINDVLDLSRIESGTLNLQLEAVDLRDTVSSVLSLVAQDTQRRRITITQNIPDTAARVIGDSTRVKQILINLLSNAIKYNTDGGRIHIATRSNPRDSIEIVVTDTGLGMTPQQLAQLFQPFNRLGRERSALEGTGIGLVISQRLTELMGGTLRARSAAGEGSSFILSLPRAEPADSAHSDLGDFADASSNYRQRTVHYVEDNETNVEVMRGILSRRQQVRFEVSTTGLDGLAAIRQQRPDLILLDMHLPDIDGLELLRHLKSDQLTSDIPVIVVSADALAHQIDTAMEAGAYYYLTKPVSVTQLLAVIDAVLESADTHFG